MRLELHLNIVSTPPHEDLSPKLRGFSSKLNFQRQVPPLKKKNNKKLFGSGDTGCIFSFLGQVVLSVS